MTTGTSGDTGAGLLRGHSPSMLAIALVLILAAPACGGHGHVRSPTLVATAARACLLDPAHADAETASIDWRTRAIYVQHNQGIRKTVIPATAPGGSYAYTAPALSSVADAVAVGANLKQPDGTWQAGLWRFNLATGQPTLVVPTDNGKVDVDAPAFSPDGRWLAFTLISYGPGLGPDQRSLLQTFSVWVVRADGADARRVDAGRNPRWSSDGRDLGFDPQSKPGPALGLSVVDTRHFAPVQVNLETCSSLP